MLSLALFMITAITNTAFSQNESAQVIDSTKTIIIKVKGADCTNDLMRMSANIVKQNGVSSCEIVKQAAVAKFEVAYNPTLITRKEINAVIENTSGCGNPNERPYKVKNK